jgi:hypothetical protein
VLKYYTKGFYEIMWGGSSMKHLKTLALVLTVLTCVCIGDITTLKAEPQYGPQISVVLPERGEGLARLSLGELGRAVLRAEQRLGFGSGEESSDCKRPLAPAHFRDEQKSLDPIVRDLFQMLARRDDLIRKIDNFRQARLVLEKVLAEARGSQYTSAMQLAVTMLVEADPRLTQQGSMQEKTLKESGERDKKAIKDAKNTEEKARKDLMELEATQRRAEEEINRIQEEFDQRLAPRDDNSLTVFQRLIAYGEQRQADHFESEILRLEDLAMKGRFKLEFVGELIRVPPQRFATLKWELENMTSRGDSGRVQLLLAQGADICQPPGHYSPLALAKIFGEARTARALRGHRGTVTVPWDPYREESPRQVVAMLDNQLARVQSFLSSVRMMKGGGAAEQPEYYTASLRYWGCRISALKSAYPRPFHTSR